MWQKDIPKKINTIMGLAHNYLLRMKIKRKLYLAKNCYFLHTIL